VYTYSVHTTLSQLLNVSSCLKSIQVDMPLSSQVKSIQMCSSRPRSTWGHFSLKLGHVSVPQRLAGLWTKPFWRIIRYKFFLTLVTFYCYRTKIP